MREKNGDVRKSILNASGNDKNKMESCAVSTSKNSLVQRKRPKENKRDYDALTEIEVRNNNVINLDKIINFFIIF